MNSLETYQEALQNREKILSFEEKLSQLPEAGFGDNPKCRLIHKFCQNLYVREIHIPQGTVLTGKIHRHAHPNFLMEGEALVFTEQNQMEHLKAPLSMISEPGTKRVVYALSDLKWITVHEVGSERDLSKIEEIVIAPDYDKLEEFKPWKELLELDQERTIV